MLKHTFLSVILLLFTAICIAAPVSSEAPPGEIPAVAELLTVDTTDDILLITTSPAPKPLEEGPAKISFDMIEPEEPLTINLQGESFHYRHNAKDNTSPGYMNRVHDPPMTYHKKV